MSIQNWFVRQWEKLGSSYDSSSLNENFKGILIDARVWNFVLWPGASLVTGLVLAIVLELLLPGSTSLTSLLLIWLIASAFIFWPDGKETVPAGHVAMLTFFGRRLRIYRTEGDYYWKGKVLFLDRSRVVKGEGTTGRLNDEGDVIGDSSTAGFIRITPFQVQVWNSSKEPNVIRIKAQASNNASIVTTLTLSLQLYDPYLWIQYEDPLLALADRAREAFRGAVRYFTDSDCSSLKHRLGKLVEGFILIAAFVPKSYKKDRPHSIIQNRSGQIIAKTFDPKTPPGEEEIRQLQEEVKGSGDEEAVRANCGIEEGEYQASDIRVEQISVEKSVETLISDLGANITDAAVGDVQLSERVQEAGDEASSEIEQRVAQTTSAATQNKASKIIGEAVKRDGELAATIAAGLDNVPGVKVAVIGGNTADKLSRAAATHATLNNKGGDSE